MKSLPEHFRGARKAIEALMLALGLLVTLAHPASASENRFWLVNQSDFGAKRGFYLDFENSASGNAPPPLSTLRLILGVADGSAWHFLTSTPPWRYDHDYQVKVIIGTHDAQVWLDGQKIASEPCGFVPDADVLAAGAIPSWAHDAADYWIVPTRVHVAPDSGKALTFDFPRLDVSQMLFEPQTPRRAEGWTIPSGKALTIEATFHLTLPPSDLHTLAPFVDRYGQLRDSDWRGKTHSEQDLQQARSEEGKRLQSWEKGQSDYDPYGGWRRAGWKSQSTGFFQTVRHNGVWWLLTPDGNPCFYTSVCSAPALEWERTPITGREALFAELPPHDGAMAAAWGGDSWGQDPGIQSLAFCTVNLIRKYGTDWQNQFQQETAHRLHAWGFSGLGKWCDPLPGVPDIPVLSRGGVPTLAGHPDPFDPATQVKLRDVLAPQITPRRDDPRVVAWSLGNEHDEIITAGEIRAILGKGRDVPAKRALMDEALDYLYATNIEKMAAAWGITLKDPPRDEFFNVLYDMTQFHAPDADIEALRRFYADRYYGLIEQAVKALDPHHLYAGFWIVPGWWENEEDWRLIARHCDVIGYDNYAFGFADARLTRLLHEADKPALCGEFSFPPQYDGARGFGFYDAAWAGDEKDAGRLYAQYVGEAVRSPYCVGVAWFQYRDEPLTGRGPGHGPGLVYGEHYAFGVVDIADHPKWDLLTAMRRTNLNAAKIRSQTERK